MAPRPARLWALAAGAALLGATATTSTQDMVTTTTASTTTGNTTTTTATTIVQTTVETTLAITTTSTTTRGVFNFQMCTEGKSGMKKPSPTEKYYVGSAWVQGGKCICQGAQEYGDFWCNINGLPEFNLSNAEAAWAIANVSTLGCGTGVATGEQTHEAMKHDLGMCAYYCDCVQPSCCLRGDFMLQGGVVVSDLGMTTDQYAAAVVGGIVAVGISILGRCAFIQGKSQYVDNLDHE